MGKDLKIGIIGTGKFSVMHLLAWRSIDLINSIGVYGSDKDRISKFSKINNITPYTDIDSLVRDSDIIDIVSANNTHCDYALNVLNNAKSILIEKPIDIDYEKAKKFSLLSKDKDIAVSVISQYRFAESYIELKKLIMDGTIGDIRLCRICVIWPRGDEYFNKNSGWRKSISKAGGGVLIHQCIHFIDLLHWFFGPVHSVIGRTISDNDNQDTVEHTFIGDIEFKSGTSCQIFFSTSNFSYFKNYIEVFGSKNYVTARDQHLYLGTNNRKDLIKNLIPNTIHAISPAEKVSTLLKRQFNDFILSISNNKPPAVTLNDGLTALNTTLKLYESFILGKRIYL
ncbi:MAG: Gfo/Idh/MocA family oxidoreductase [Nitrospirae bacterium]|nr:Gfo/Idh/MocA family oxidoreductase [Nitrospirota bacterium]